ncbi:hypothetical protein GCM10010211_58180 [Streptomyces albospinus]|uniref:FAD-binding domain-containing protein n=1 Tax=Streptomyces albospinus TaxID=285515 RepID=A0ABQ2VHZ0_9ACTN|nr:hypothetical protein GCM10010211_58180 [Streptomyces albospinus]
MQDAYNLGWKLADGSPELLDSYESERRTTADRVLGTSSQLLRKYREGAEDTHERGANTRQLDVTYRTTEGRIVAGDRAPDAPVTDANGKTVRLFDLYRGPHATHLTFGALAPDRPHAYAVLRPAHTSPGPHVIDTQGHAYGAYDASDGTSLLIRPDRYIGRRHSHLSPTLRHQRISRHTAVPDTADTTTAIRRRWPGSTTGQQAATRTPLNAAAERDQVRSRRRVLPRPRLVRRSGSGRAPTHLRTAATFASEGVEGFLVPDEAGEALGATTQFQAS